MSVIDVQGTLAAAPGQLGQAEQPRHALALVPRLEWQHRVEPRLHDLRMHHGVERTVEELAGPETRQGEEGVRRHGTAPQAFQECLAELLASA